MSESIVYQKAYLFAIEVVKLYKLLSMEKKEFVLSRQMLRPGTSIGANVNEAVSSESKRDFVHKLSIALKKRERRLTVSLLKDSEYITPEQFSPLSNSCTSLIKILSSIIITTKERYFKKQSTTHNS
ncbi:four helix bundle protein [Flavisolibacter ginsenosidimutans]|uniref:Four helix bundle protein n=1 Tax=Flavisolibacter ginsenosidimutans TaxID=661481 RepID=A0A5B8UGU2_9BACT|nr:four helix bundle protein [Flavisolibacter ginsenosidimutans]QEC55738.1 four helix bundle protein [Flavisolibacter ginsenosidimutans]